MQFGDGLLRLCPHAALAQQGGQKVMMYDVFDMIHPRMAICYANIHHFMNAVFLLQIKSQDKQDGVRCSLILKGTLICQTLPAFYKSLGRDFFNFA